jgi:hypothetical protein
MSVKQRTPKETLRRLGFLDSGLSAPVFWISLEERARAAIQARRIHHGVHFSPTLERDVKTSVRMREPAAHANDPLAGRDRCRRVG